MDSDPQADNEYWGKLVKFEGLVYDSYASALTDCIFRIWIEEDSTGKCQCPSRFRIVQCGCCSGRLSACKCPFMSLQYGSLHMIDWRGHEYTATDASQKMTPKCQLSLKHIL